MKDICLKLLDKISNAGFEAYAVGGFVRDSLIGIKTNDIDVCTSATVKDLCKIFKNVILIKEKYGSVIVKFKRVRFEITTFRKETSYSDNRHPDFVEIITDLKDDLLRRDFTINAICMDKTGQIIDLLGAINDINNKTICMIGNPTERLKEDSLRILRAIRFSSKLGFKLDEYLENAIIDNRSYLEKLSFYRKKDELNKILSLKNASLGIDLIKRFSLETFLGINISSDFVITKDIYGMWAQIEYSNKYPFNKKEINLINSVKEILKKKKITNIDLYYKDLYVCSVAGEILKYNQKELVRQYNNLPIHTVKDIKVNSTDVCNVLNLKDKTKISQIMKDLEIKILTLKLTNDVDSITQYLLSRGGNYE